MSASDGRAILRVENVGMRFGGSYFMTLKCAP